MLLNVRNGFARYRIACPAGSEIRQNHHGIDFLVVHEDSEPFWLFDALLIEAARCGIFGLRVISCEPVN